MKTRIKNIVPKWLLISIFLIILWAGVIYYAGSHRGPVTISQISYEPSHISFLAQNTTDKPLIAYILISSGGVVGRSQSSAMVGSQLAITLKPFEKRFYSKEFFWYGGGYPEVTVTGVSEN